MAGGRGTLGEGADLPPSGAPATWAAVVVVPPSVPPPVVTVVPVSPVPLAPIEALPVVGAPPRLIFPSAALQRRVRIKI